LFCLKEDFSYRTSVPFYFLSSHQTVSSATSLALRLTAMVR
jgi:hypothetical protein